MNRCYITPQGDYYEGDRAHTLDREVPQRPDANHVWNGSAWEPDAAKIRAREVEEAKRKLEAIDRASIRALREWVAKQTDAPQILKDKESEAISEREKLKDK